MLDVTPEAHEELMNVIRQNEASIIRIVEKFDGG